MNFPRYWAKGSYTGTTCDGKKATCCAFGWSSESLTDAEAKGRQRAQLFVEKGIGSDKRKEYEYGEAPFREEVIDSIQLDGNDVAIISRNRYGSLVLNSANVMFVDIDLPRIVSTGFWDAVRLHFSSKKRKERRQIVESISLDLVQAWHQENPTKSFRLYRTHSGLRLLLTDKVYDPKGDESKGILTDLDSDPLYRALTERQGCYRARLTPKPWRCRTPRPPSSFPWSDPEDEKKYRAWEDTYSKASKQYATCALIREYGSETDDPVIRQVVACHDSFTISAQSLPLA